MKEMTMKLTMNKIHNPEVNETLLHTVLENGLPVYILPKKGFEQKYAIFATNYGSIDDKFRVHGNGEVVKVPDGIAHFLEHKMFENEDLNTFDKFAALGANVNAFTTYTSTSYLFDTIENFDESLDLLLDFVQSLYLTDESVEKEKGIIAQEINMYDDDPDWVGYLNLMKCLFHNHLVRVDIAGSVESIYEIDRNALTQCYETFYHPSNMVLFLQGDFDVDQVIERVQANQLKKNYSPQPPIERFYPEEPRTVAQRRMEATMSVSRPIYNLGFKEQNLGKRGDELLKQDLLTNMLLELLVGKGSELYQEMYASGLIDDSFAVSYTGENDHGMTVIGSHTTDPERLHQVLMHGIEARKGHLTPEGMERVRKRMIGDYIVAFDSLKATAQNFVSYFFKEMNLFHELQILNSITLTDLEERLQEHFDVDYHAVSLILPAEPENR